MVVAGLLMSSMVPAANFYSDAARTTLAAAALERHLGSETDDLFDATLQRRRRVRLVGIAGLAMAVFGWIVLVGSWFVVTMLVPESCDNRPRLEPVATYRDAEQADTQQTIGEGS